MIEINFDIDGAIKQLQKINPNKVNGPDKVEARFLRETAMECGAMFHRLLCSVILPWRTAISFDSYPVNERARNQIQ